MTLIRSVIILLSLFLIGNGLEVRAENHILADLVAESSVPFAGGTTTVALRMRPQAGWHGYWSNPGEAGFPARLDWKLPTGVRVSAPRYPVPETLLVSGLMNHVFNGEYALLAKVELPAGLAVGTKLPLKLSADWLACTHEICVPEHGDLALELLVGDGKIVATTQQKFDGWRTKLPRPLGGMAHFETTGTKVRIGIPFPAGAKISTPWFFALTENAVSYAALQTISRKGDLLIVETTRDGTLPKILDGVLATGAGQGLEIRAVPGPVPTGGDPVAGGKAAPITVLSILLALGGAVLGGLLLNIMPCVFPVISLKAMSLARAGGNERETKQEALAYAGGVILTCVALGGALLALRAGGTSVGWAFQLQDPRVILFLFLLVGAIALNLVGLFHLRGFGGGEALAGQGGTAGAFWTGAFAAFVATPCTGPFMAAALGAALVLPTLAALAIFAGLGLGLALPFLLLGFVPRLRTWIPKPGAWMATFQRWLSIPMFVTAATLAWLLWRQTGQGGLLIGLAGITVLLALLWWSRRALPAGLGFGVLLIGLVGLTAAGSPLLPRGQAVQSLPTGALAFSEARLSALRAQKRAVFLYFTADWCLTCKVNEKAAIDRGEVQKAFKAKGITVMVGDWTNGDAVIGRFLEAQGRSGVPLYLFYAGDGSPPRELPQVLTPGILTAL